MKVQCQQKHEKFREFDFSGNFNSQKKLFNSISRTVVFPILFLVKFKKKERERVKVTTSLVTVHKRLASLRTHLFLLESLIRFNIREAFVIQRLVHPHFVTVRIVRDSFVYPGILKYSLHISRLMRQFLAGVYVIFFIVSTLILDSQCFCRKKKQIH